MAEFCLDCFKELNGGDSFKVDDKKIILSEEEELCEGCVDFKKVVVRVLE